MASLISNGYYAIIFTKMPSNNDDVVFIKDFVENLFSDFSSHIDEPFVLKIEEFHYGRMEATWEIEVQSTDQKTHNSNIDTGNVLIRTSASQFYHARSQLSERENYTGSIKMSVIMPACKLQLGYCSRSAAKVLLRLAYAHYYEGIVKHYGDWETDYINAPKYSETAVDKTSHWREDDDSDKMLE